MDINLLGVFIPVFLLIFIGFVTGRFSKVQKSTIKVLSDLTLYILVPALIITSLAKMTLTSVFWLIVLSAVFIVVVTAFLAYIISKIKKLKDNTRRGFLMTTMFMNAGSLASSICLLFYGPEGFILAIIFYITTQILLYTLGIFIASSRKGRSNLHSLRTVVSLPLIYALLVGILFSYYRIGIPVLVLRPLELLSSAAVPLLLITLGLQLSVIKVKISKLNFPALSTTVRMGFGLLLGFVFAHMGGLRGIPFGVVIIASAMPTKITTFPIAQKFNCDIENVTLSIFLSTAISLLTIPLILGLLSL